MTSPSDGTVGVSLNYASGLAYKTSLGAMYASTVENFFRSPESNVVRGKVQMILTSPPFPLNRKKKYGNQQGSVMKEHVPYGNDEEGENVRDEIVSPPRQELDVDRWIQETEFAPPPGGEFIVPAAETFTSPGKRPSRAELKKADESIAAAVERARARNRETTSTDEDVAAKFVERVIEKLITSDSSQDVLDYIQELRLKGETPRDERGSAT